MSLVDKIKGKKPDAPAADAPVESLSRIQVVSRAERALKLLLPLHALCQELSTVDSLDRMVEDARVRLAQADAAQAEQLGRHADELATAKARTVQEIATRETEMARMAEVGRQALADAESRARAMISGTEQTAQGMIDKAAQKATELEAKATALAEQVTRLSAEVEAKAGEVAASEAKLAKVRKAASALLDGG